jgi:hypothetical protein
VEQLLETLPDDDIGRFNSLAQRWKKNTAHLSTIGKKALHHTPLASWQTIARRYARAFPPRRCETAIVCQLAGRIHTISETDTRLPASGLIAYCFIPSEVQR